MIINLTNDNTKEIIQNAIKPIIIKVFANWCPPCFQMDPIFKEISEELESKYTFAKLNVDEAQQVATEFDITVIPTFIFIKNNKITGKETGYIPKAALITRIEEHLD